MHFNQADFALEDSYIQMCYHTNEIIKYQPLLWFKQTLTWTTILWTGIPIRCETQMLEGLINIEKQNRQTHQAFHRFMWKNNSMWVKNRINH